MDQNNEVEIEERQIIEKEELKVQEEIQVQEDIKIQEESIFLDLVDEMYCGSLSQELVQDFVCGLCYGIVQSPIKCIKCNNLVCQFCVNQKKLKDKKLKCFKKCGSNKFSSLSSTEQQILDRLVFCCQTDRDECKEKIPYNKYRAHLIKFCKVQTFKKVLLASIADKITNDNESEKEESPCLNPYKNLFFIGDLNKLYLEEDEELDEDIINQNKEAHDEYRNKLMKLNRNDGNGEDYGDQDYGDDDDYGGYGEERMGNGEEEGLEEEHEEEHEEEKEEEPEEEKEKDIEEDLKDNKEQKVKPEEKEDPPDAQQDIHDGPQNIIIQAGQF